EGAIEELLVELGWRQVRAREFRRGFERAIDLARVLITGIATGRCRAHVEPLTREAEESVATIVKDRSYRLCWRSNKGVESLTSLPILIFAYELRARDARISKSEIRNNVEMLDQTRWPKRGRRV